MNTMLVVLFLLPGFQQEKKSPDWKEFTSKEGRFKVLMPDTPKQRENETESDFGKATLIMETVEHAGGMFGANYCDYPADIKKLSADRVLDSSRDGCVANLDGKLLSDKKIKLGGHPGRDIQVEVDGKHIFRARVYLVEQRLYQVVVFGPKDLATSKDALKFLDSFELVEEKEKK